MISSILSSLTPSPVIPSVVKPVDSRPKGTLFRLEVPRARINIITKGPIIIEPMPDLGINSTHSFHVRLPPLSPKVFCLHLEQLQNVKLKHGMLDLQGALQDRSRFENHQHHDPGMFPFCQFVQNPKQVYATG